LLIRKQGRNIGDFMKKKKKGYFLIIDPQKNTLRISTEDDWLIENIVKNTANIKKHKTIKELIDEVRDYLKGGGLDNDEN
jgi:hypothetical protein